MRTKGRLFEITVSFTYAERRFVAQDETEATGRVLRTDEKYWCLTVSEAMAKAWIDHIWRNDREAVCEIKINDITPWNDARGLVVIDPEAVARD